MRNAAACLIWVVFSGSAFAQDVPASRTEDSEAVDAIHAQLRVVRERMFSAYEKRDMDALLEHVEPDVVITWQNADRNEGHQQFREFYDRMMNGENGIVKDISSTFEVDDLSVLYGDNTAVARGTLADEFALNDGSNFTLNSKWTATLVKTDEAWRVASFHVSANIFDNPILDVAKGWLMKAGIAGGVVGLILGLLIGRASKRQTKVT